jgi:hypothetical protein
MPRRYIEPILVHHTFQANDGGGAVTALTYAADGLIVAGGGITANPIAPRPMRLVRVAVHALCLVINSAGDWTLRVRVNEAGTDSATFTHPIAVAPAGSKTAGVPSTVVTLNAGDTYHILADGPSRNFVVSRVTLEWELL